MRHYFSLIVRVRDSTYIGHDFGNKERVMFRGRGRVALTTFSLLLLGGAQGCANEPPTRAAPPPRGTAGEEVYGILCDRVGAQALREDLTGASYRDICHRPVGGTFADRVDETRLPAIDGVGYNVEGKAFSTEEQKIQRARALGHLDALVRRRSDLIKGLDAIVADVKVPIRDTKNANEKLSCNMRDNLSESSNEDRLPRQVADLLGRFVDLYNDGTIPESTRSLARVIRAFGESGDAQKAWSRFDARKGYRPPEAAFGVLRPAASYPRLRDLAASTLRVMSDDSKPYDPNPARDENGRRIPTPGKGYSAFSTLLGGARLELLDAKPKSEEATLTRTTDAQGKTVLSRPRTGNELLDTVVFTADDAFKVGAPALLTRRDKRGVAALAGGVAAPFVDADNDGLPDLDDAGQYVTVGGVSPPSPFVYAGGPESARDAEGRALLGGKPVYATIDVSKTFAAHALSDVRGIISGEIDEVAKRTDLPPRGGPLMDAFAGAYVLFGSRDGNPQTEKKYESGSIVYDGFHADDAALLDLTHALLQIAASPGGDDLLLAAKTLMKDQMSTLASVTRSALAAKDIANGHNEAKITKDSMFWDETLEVLARMAKVPGLLEDVLKALGEPDSAGISDQFGRLTEMRDELGYDRNDINGPPVNLTSPGNAGLVTPVDRLKPATGQNRSNLHQFFSLVADVRGVTVCNKEGAVVHAKGIPLAGDLDLPLFGGTYKECEVLKIENLAAFYLRSMVGKATIYMRPSILRNGVLGVGATTVNTIELSGNITGFWDAGTAYTFRPKPQFLNRLAFFNLEEDSPTQTGKNFTTNRFVSALAGTQIGTAVCPERVIPDPDPTAIDASSDRQVHGLRSCAQGDWVRDRHTGVVFALESPALIKAVTPLVNAFVNHGREDLFVDLSAVISNHWANAEASAAECKIAGGECSRSGLVSYEATVVDVLKTDLLPSLANFARIGAATNVDHCEAVDAKGACTRTSKLNAVDALARVVREAVDPDRARERGITDRRGDAVTQKNNGETIRQVTPVYLLANAVRAMDAAFVKYGASHPDGGDRLNAWKTGRSGIVDHYLRVQGTGAQTKFTNPALAKMGPVLIDLLREQAWAKCPKSFAPPYDRCKWLSEDASRTLADIVSGPLFAGVVDLGEAVRKDLGARGELEAFIDYLVSPQSTNAALTSTLLSAHDAVQLLQDETNLQAFYQVVGEALVASTRDARGRAVDKGLVDAQLGLLSRVNGMYIDETGTQLCSREIDPNGILVVMLKNLLTPFDGELGVKLTPLEVLVDVAADVNKVDPQSPIDKLTNDDYKSIADNVNDFLVNKERGLEQLYEVIRQSTIK